MSDGSRLVVMRATFSSTWAILFSSDTLQSVWAATAKVSLSNSSRVVSNAQLLIRRSFDLYIHVRTEQDPKRFAHSE